jgi:predicted nucleic acid-binding protein
MTIVADSGPILSFARANRLELFHQVMSDLTIPDAVYEDIVVRGAGKPGATEVQGASWIRRLSVRDRTFVDQLPPKLHLGEREAIALAKEQGAALLVDEREARREALRQSITILGSLTILREAKTRGIIPRVTPILDELIAAGLYTSEALYEAFLRQLDEAEDTQSP